MSSKKFYDHGQVDGYNYAPDDVVNITSQDFDVEDPDTWGYAPQEQRVWGMTAHGGRLYYALAEGPSVWSVAINRKLAALVDDPREEFVLPRANARAEISDMLFAGDGALILGQRGPLIGTFDSEQITREGRSSALCRRCG